MSRTDAAAVASSSSSAEPNCCCSATANPTTRQQLHTNSQEEWKRKKRRKEDNGTLQTEHQPQEVQGGQRQQGAQRQQGGQRRQQLQEGQRRHNKRTLPLALFKNPLQHFLPFWHFFPHIRLLLVLILLQQLPIVSASSSSFSALQPCRSALLIRVPWAELTQQQQKKRNPLYLLLEYSPPRGHPASPFTLSPPLDRHQPELAIPINGTWPSVGYQFRLFAVYSENASSRDILYEGIAYSSPGKPVLISVAATDRTCTLAYSPPPEPYARREHFNFHLEYFPVDRPGEAASDAPREVFFARTNASSVRLRRLKPGTQYRLALYAEFFAVRSLCPLELTFRTKPERPQQKQQKQQQTTAKSEAKAEATAKSEAKTTTNEEAKQELNPEANPEANEEAKTKAKTTAKPEETTTTTASPAEMTTKNGPRNTTTKPLEENGRKVVEVDTKMEEEAESVGAGSVGGAGLEGAESGEEESDEGKKTAGKKTAGNISNGTGKQNMLGKAKVGTTTMAPSTMTTLAPSTMAPSSTTTLARSTTTLAPKITAEPSKMPSNAGGIPEEKKVPKDEEETQEDKDVQEVPEAKGEETAETGEIPKLETKCQKTKSQRTKSQGAKSHQNESHPNESHQSAVDEQKAPKKAPSPGKKPDNIEHEVGPAQPTKKLGEQEEDREEENGSAESGTEENGTAENGTEENGTEEGGTEDKSVDPQQQQSAGKNEQQSTGEGGEEGQEGPEGGEKRHQEEEQETSGSDSNNGGGGDGNNAAAIRVRQLGRTLLELGWDLPDLVPCDAFLVRHNATGREAAVRTDNQPAVQIPFSVGSMVQVHISCLFENSVSPQWSARRLIDLRRPQPVRSVRLIRAFTDDYFRSSVLLGFAVPTGANFRFYELQVAWALGKKVVGRHSRVFRGAHIKGGEGRLNISGLEPARLYTLAIRNVSRELTSQSSAPIGLRLTTPPIITSTLYAGKISCDAINVNFGESDPEHLFDHYELHFSALNDSSETAEEDSSGNAVRRLAKNDPQSLTFSKLVPGKTYKFSLFTVLKGVRSRPVTVLITTYPHKVPSLRPLMAPGSVLLFWTVENPAQNLCRFRVSYTASAGPNLHRAVSVELNGTAVRHRFSGLEWNTFYTFTVIVIMGPTEAEAESESESVTIGMPGKPRSVPQLQRYGSRELLLTFENDRDSFHDRNGVISHFAIIVAEQMDGTAEQVGDLWELPSWYDVRERADGTELPWDAFRASASDYHPFKRRNSPRSTQFVIGSEDCAMDRRPLDEPYCNGPLRANLDYWVKVRAYSVAGIAMETQWVGVNGQASLSEVGKRKEEEEKKRRFPCYLYLNGCNNNSNGAAAAPQAFNVGGHRLLVCLIAVAIVSSFIVTPVLV